MAITKEKKGNILQKIKEIVKNSETVVFVNFKGLNVKETTNLRNSLRDAGSSYMVVKKTLAKKTLQETPITGDIPELEGELAFAYGQDQIAPARGVYEFQKKHKNRVSILGGIFEGGYADQTKMLAIAQIPGLQVLYGQFVNLINSPIQGLVVALDKIAEKREGIAV
ncbi:MAG: 50S ribosomal protein L10 [Patescibacteria group bacterium]